MMEAKAFQRKGILGLMMVMTILLLLFSAKIVSAKTYPEKPKYDDSGSYTVYSVQLSKKYSYLFTADNEGAYADIIGRHTVAVKQLNRYEIMILAGEYKGRYYFNRLFEDITVGVYSWKPGETSFRREAKGLALDQFKRYHKLPWTGAKIGKYVTAAVGWPMDPSPRNKLYSYNLVTGHKRLLDKSVFGARNAGKKFYYVKGIRSKFGFKRLDIKRCNPNGKGKIVIKRIYLKNNSYVKYANFTKHYVKTRSNGKFKKYRYR